MAVAAFVDPLQGCFDLLQDFIFIAYQVEGKLLFEGVRANVGHVAGHAH